MKRAVKYPYPCWLKIGQRRRSAFQTKHHNKQVNKLGRRRMFKMPSWHRCIQTKVKQKTSPSPACKVNPCWGNSPATLPARGRRRRRQRGRPAGWCWCQRKTYCSFYSSSASSRHLGLPILLTPGKWKIPWRARLCNKKYALWQNSSHFFFLLEEYFD